MADVVEGAGIHYQGRYAQNRMSFLSDHVPNGKGRFSVHLFRAEGL